MLSEIQIKKLSKEELEKTVKFNADMIKGLTYGNINTYKSILKEL